MTTTMTLADLAATSLSAIRILEQHGLDYCCGGKQPFEEACLAKGVKPQTIIREIEEAKVASVAGRDWQTAPLDELVKHIVGTHHEYLKLDLPVLGHRLDKVVSVHGARDPEVLPRMAEVFAALRAEMEMHMHKEESDPVSVHRAVRPRRGPESADASGSLWNDRQPDRDDGARACERGRCARRNPHVDQRFRTAPVCLQYGSGAL